jgi:hypothetical protein
MNIVRTKIVVFWLLFSLGGLLLCFSWRYRLLWIALFVPALVILAPIKPRSPVPPPTIMAPTIMFLTLLVLFLTVFAIVVHGFLFPQSASLYLALKILLPLLSFPLFCYKAYADYVAFRSPCGGIENGTDGTG